MKNNPWKNLIRPGLALLLVVIGCGITARFLANGETLEEYAVKQEPISSAPAVEATVSADPVPEAPPAADTGSSTETKKEEEPVQTNSHSLSAITENAANAASQESAATPEAPPADEPAAEPAESTATEGPAVSVLVDDSDVLQERTVYAEGFFYEPIPATVYRRMIGNSYPEDCPISLDSLSYLNILYIDFNDQEQTGEIVCARSIAEDLVEIFYDLYQGRYQLERVRLVDDYGADDDASMLANNTSCFNYRTVAGTTTLSNHAKGLAIDINPLYNPWINHGKVTLPEAEPYGDRTKDFPHKITADDLCTQSFTNHGFFWGGNWNNPDYQHYQKN